jgi:hypothetical protein
MPSGTDPLRNSVSRGGSTEQCATGDFGLRRMSARPHLTLTSTHMTADRAVRWEPALGLPGVVHCPSRRSEKPVRAVPWSRRSLQRGAGGPGSNTQIAAVRRGWWLLGRHRLGPAVLADLARRVSQVRRGSTAHRRCLTAGRQCRPRRVSWYRGALQPAVQDRHRRTRQCPRARGVLLASGPSLPPFGDHPSTAAFCLKGIADVTRAHHRLH